MNNTYNGYEELLKIAKSVFNHYKGVNSELNDWEINIFESAKKAIATAEEK